MAETECAARTIFNDPRPIILCQTQFWRAIKGTAWSAPMFLNLKRYVPMLSMLRGIKKNKN